VTFEETAVKRDFLTVLDVGREGFLRLLNEAEALKKRSRLTLRRDAPLEGRVLGLIFQKPSTRTRVSFEVAMERLGGRALYLGWSDLQLGRGETIADTAPATLMSSPPASSHTPPSRNWHAMLQSPS